MASNNNGIFSGGEMAARINAFKWSQTPLRAIESWSLSLKSLVKTLLASRYPMVLIWGFVRMDNRDRLPPIKVISLNRGSWDAAPPSQPRRGRPAKIGTTLTDLRVTKVRELRG